MSEEKGDGERAKRAEPQTEQKPPVPLHDPFNRFNFEPTDGGDF